MKKIIVTGAAGLLGRHVAAAFAEKEYEVIAFDVIKADGCQILDLTDLDAVLDALPKADCVAHVASIPRPVGYEANYVFTTNMQLMFTLQTAMETLGIETLLFASSFSVLGLPFAPQQVDISYFPIDEAHPVAPQDVYAVTKWLGEEMVEAWARRTRGRAASIRMPWIQTAQSFAVEVGPRRLLDEACLDLWAYIDARDAASAFVAAAEAAMVGHYRFFISAADTYSQEETASLVARAYPDVEPKVPLEGFSTLLCNRTAERLIGYRPEYSWRDY